MTLAQARALHAGVNAIEHDARRDAGALQALARWMLRFSPMVSVVDAPPNNDRSPLECAGPLERAGPMAPSGSYRIRLGKFSSRYDIARLAPPAAGEYPAIYIDLSGTQRLHGDPAGVAEQIAATLRQWNISASLGMGQTIGSAWAATFPPLPASDRATRSSDRSGFPTPPGARPVDDLPVAALRLPPDTLAALDHLGIATIGQLRQLPRDALPARFGETILRRLDQAAGQVDEILQPIRPLAPIVACQRWENPLPNLQWVWPVAMKLLEQLCRQLARYGLGAREMLVTLRLAIGDPVRRTVRFSRPTRDPRRMFDLLREVLSNCRLPIANCRLKSTTGSRKSEISPDLSAIDYQGLTAIHLEVTRCEPVSAEQMMLPGADEQATRRELDDLVERLRARMSPAAVAQARLVESYVPERAYVLQEELTPSRNAGGCTSDHRAWDACGCSAAGFPVCLFFPREVRVIVAPSGDRDGRPVQVTTPDGRVIPVVHSIGPRRIAGEWWIGHDKSRDYFDAELAGGRRWLLFRVNETGRWFWQGEF